MRSSTHLYTDCLFLQALHRGGEHHLLPSAFSHSTDPRSASVPSRWRHLMMGMAESQYGPIPIPGPGSSWPLGIWSYTSQMPCWREFLVFTVNCSVVS
jgi:hypothetical protein